MSTRGIVGRGLFAGLSGGAAVAIWFLLIDASQGVPFRTPALLANGLAGRDGLDISAGLVASYTLIHFLAFAVVGVSAAWLMDRLPVSPGAIMGFVLGFLLFDLVFYGSVIVTGVDVVNALGWPQVLAGNLLAGLIVMRVLHATRRESATAEWSHALADHHTIREGLVAGMIGAIAVAAWFFAFDVMQERPFFTPAALGSALFTGARSIGDIDVNALTVLGYTAVHVVAFATVGLLGAGLIRQAEDQPTILLGGLVIFVVFEALFLGLLAVVAQFLMGPLAWWSIAGGNLVATVCMGLYFWRRHPGLYQQLDSGHMFGAEDAEPDGPARAA